MELLQPLSSRVSQAASPRNTNRSDSPNPSTYVPAEARLNYSKHFKNIHHELKCLAKLTEYDKETEVVYRPSKLKITSKRNPKKRNPLEKRKYTSRVNILLTNFYNIEPSMLLRIHKYWNTNYNKDKSIAYVETLQRTLGRLAEHDENLYPKSKDHRFAKLQAVVNGNVEQLCTKSYLNACDEVERALNEGDRPRPVSAEGVPMGDRRIHEAIETALNTHRTTISTASSNSSGMGTGRPVGNEGVVSCSSPSPTARNTITVPLTAASQGPGMTFRSDYTQSIPLSPPSISGRGSTRSPSTNTTVIAANNNNNQTADTQVADELRSTPVVVTSARNNDGNGLFQNDASVVLDSPPANANKP